MSVTGGKAEVIPAEPRPFRNRLGENSNISLKNIVEIFKRVVFAIKVRHGFEYARPAYDHPKTKFKFLDLQSEFLTLLCIENPRVGGSIPSLGTIPNH